MRHINVIGIGAGDPDHLTLQAVKAFARTDVFLLLDKNDQRQELVQLRLRMIEEHGRPGHRLVQVPDAERDRATPAYREAVHDWRRRRAELVAGLIEEHIAPDGTGALLAWGDPALYDSVSAVLDEILADDPTAFSYDVIPGISSPSVLAARHRTTLTRVGRPVRITTARRLAADGFPPGAEDAVVMLDGKAAFTGIDPEGVHIHYGAYLGTPDEILVSGPLAETAEEISRLRLEAREAKGWIMDSYLLRRTED
ncbi:precorrin-6A synthase (deacetylating) [Streptacidiphilus fuscans]|uniref:Precorrin-6A synthase (Deacetylating) n=1 Tax=Streptacidiphilus fuscans TaxID=2789292 RepID=A0A931AWJ3_9ACTN|nr:precorrin-6A synthase (deacetylating) [Streptacidiphilus fuscans]MBF9066779.1 precorrin-6A synthase (deacetylating) [Streptacidiphilus fuscans]